MPVLLYRPPVASQGADRDQATGEDNNPEMEDPCSAP
jgi:hypothetical protein